MILHRTPIILEILPLGLQAGYPAQESADAWKIPHWEGANDHASGLPRSGQQFFDFHPCSVKAGFSHMYAYLVVRPYGFLRLVRLLTLLTLATPTIVCSPRFHICIWQSRMGFDQFDGSSLWRCQVSAARNRRGPVLLAASWPKAMAFGTMDRLSQSEEANCEHPPTAFVDCEPMSWPNKIDSSATLPCSWVWRHQPLGFRLVRWKEASGAEVVCTCSSSSQQKLPHNKKNMTSIDIWYMKPSGSMPGHIAGTKQSHLECHT